MKAAEALREAAEFYYEACGLCEDEDLDPEDSLEVVRRAFSSSDCDDFAFVLSLVTGWQCVRAEWSIPDWGFGHHALVRAPDGRLLDVTGWTDGAEVAKRYAGTSGSAFRFADAEPVTSAISCAPGGEAQDEDVLRIVSVIMALPYAPYDEGWLREKAAAFAGTEAPAVRP